VGSKAFGGLNRRLKEKTAESRWFETTGQAPFGRAKAAYWKINDLRVSACLFSVSCDRATVGKDEGHWVADAVIEAISLQAAQALSLRLW
jgi:hypothetical protein